MRCKACNRVMGEREIHNELCAVCKPLSDQAVYDMEAEDWTPAEPSYPHDLRWEGVVDNPPDSDD